MSSTSSSTSSLYSSTSRITSMYSDIDTDSLVKSMCSTQQSKIDKATQKETLLGWKDEALTTIKADVKTFSDTYCSALGTSSMRKASSYYAYSEIGRAHV